MTAAELAALVEKMDEAKTDDELEYDDLAAALVANAPRLLAALERCEAQDANIALWDRENCTREEERAAEDRVQRALAAYRAAACEGVEGVR